MELLQASRLKINRARKLVDELELEINAYMARNPVKVITTQSKMDGYLDWELICNEAIPLHISPILGDIVHNLRTSLDLLAIDIVKANGGDEKGVYFPFSNSAKELPVMIKKRRVYQAAPEAIELIVSLKPYKGGNTIIRYVHDLDIVDKHRSIVPRASRARVPGGALGFDESGPVPGHRHGKGTTLIEAAEKNGFLPDQEFTAVFELRFPFREPLENRELVRTSKMLVDEFSSIVDAFDTLLLGANVQG